MTTTTDPTEHPPAIAWLLRHFDFAHLPPHLAVVSERFHAAALVLAARDSWVANEIAQLASRMRSWPGPESEEAQRKLEELRGRITEAPTIHNAGAAHVLRWLRLLLEAKDCAVRAVLELQCDMAPEVAEALRDLPETADSVAGLPERLAVLAEAGAVAEVTEPDSHGYATAWVTTLGRHMVAIARATAPKTPAREPEPSEPPPEGTGARKAQGTMVEQAKPVPASALPALLTGIERLARAHNLTIAAQPHGTVYEDQGAEFHSQVYAASPEEAQRVMDARGIGERPGPWVDPGDVPASVLFARAMEAGGNPLPVVHALVFLAHLAIASRTCQPAEILGDRGWLHEAVHWLAMRSGPEWTETRDRIAAVEQRVPGVVVTTRVVPAFSEAFCRWWHEQTGEHYSPGLHRYAPPEMHSAAQAFEAGRRSFPKPDRLANLVVGIDVEEGAGLVALRGLVTELGAVADQVEAAAALRTDSLDEIEQAHVDALRGLHNAPPPVITSYKVAPLPVFTAAELQAMSEHVNGPHVAQVDWVPQPDGFWRAVGDGWLADVYPDKGSCSWRAGVDDFEEITGTTRMGEDEAKRRAEGALAVLMDSEAIRTMIASLK